MPPVAIGFMCLRLLVVLFKVKERFYAELIPVCLIVTKYWHLNHRAVYNMGPRVRVICRSKFSAMNCEEQWKFCALWSTFFSILLTVTWKSGGLQDKRSTLATVRAAIRAKFVFSESIIRISSCCTFNTLLKAACRVPSDTAVGSNNSSDTHPVLLH